MTLQIHPGLYLRPSCGKLWRVQIVQRMDVIYGMLHRRRPRYKYLNTSESENMHTSRGKRIDWNLRTLTDSSIVLGCASLSGNARIMLQFQLVKLDLPEKSRVIMTVQNMLLSKNTSERDSIVVRMALGLRAFNIWFLIKSGSQPQLWARQGVWWSCKLYAAGVPQVQFRFF